MDPSLFRFLLLEDQPKKGEPLPTIVRKATDETLSNDTTLQDDDELFFPVGVGQTWAFIFYIVYQATTVADLEIAVTVPAGADVVMTAINDIFNSVRTSGGEFVGTVSGDNTNEQIQINGTIIVGATPGNVQFQWAQETAEVSDTIVRAGSFIIAHRL